jgi:hypothetical protein
MDTISFEAFETWIENTFDEDGNMFSELKSREFFRFYFFKRLDTAQRRAIIQKLEVLRIKNKAFQF